MCDSVIGAKASDADKLTQRHAIQRNAFLHCAPEIAAVRELMAEREDNTLTLRDSKAQITIALAERGYELSGRFVLPKEYPFDLVSWTLTRSTFHPVYLGMLNDNVKSLLFALEKPDYKWRSALDRRGEFLRAVKRAVRRRNKKNKKLGVAAEADVSDDSDDDDDSEGEESQTWTPSTNDIVDLVSGGGERCARRAFRDTIFHI